MDARPRRQGPDPLPGVARQRARPAAPSVSSRSGHLQEPQSSHTTPDLFWDADPSHAKAKLSPGPNSPVGVVWIDLSLEHHGIHGA